MYEVMNQSRFMKPEAENLVLQYCTFNEDRHEVQNDFKDDFKRVYIHLKKKVLCLKHFQVIRWES
jgi:hypothetical protein